MTETNGLAVANAVRFVPVTDGGDTTTTTQKHAARLLVQATYGPTLTAIDAIAAQGTAAWIDGQLALPSTYSHVSYLKARLATNANDNHTGILQ